MVTEDKGYGDSDAGGRRGESERGDVLGEDCLRQSVERLGPLGWSMR